MQVITFYSYKGGVGRTLACANFGLYLAKSGQKVVLADMDFEAPGLDSKFSNLDISKAESGMLDQFVAFQNRREIPDIQAMDIQLAEDVAKAGGRLQIIPAGNYLRSDYYERLSELSWKTLLAEKEELAFCIDLVRRIKETCQADVLIIDSRTGLTEVGGLCTQILPDSVVLLTSTSPESLQGTKRIYERIKTSPYVKKRSDGRTDVDIRLVVTRVPRPEDPQAFEKALMAKLDIPSERLHYLFSERDLSVEEYLALNRFKDHPAILDDYIELFATFNPEKTLPYVEDRLTAFRSELTRRAPQENAQIIQELLTLFPLPEVMLEAARYYRIARDGDSKAIANYLRYLGCRNNDAEALTEFVELCTRVPEGELKPQVEVALHLRAHGIEKMEAPLLAKFAQLCGQEDWQDIVNAIEADETKTEDEAFHRVYIKALYELGEWSKVVTNASERSLRTSSLAPLIAEAYANLGLSDQAFEILRGTDMRSIQDRSRLLKTVFKIDPTMGLEDIINMVDPSGNVLNWRRLLRSASRELDMPLFTRDEHNREFITWLKRLERQSLDIG